MLLIPCPICGPRPEAEFTYAGEAHIARPPDPSALDDAAWTAFLHSRANPKGEHAERWRHTHGCGRFFNAIRNTVTDRFVTTYRAGGNRPGTSDTDPRMGPA
ncbi:MAG: sarcosine oxidase subunit delta [Acetobacteraceae bacterium]|nr:sarcosine oxidase subunit delta [Acetobacteraceae bacterium]